MRIPLPDHLRQLRDDERQARVSPVSWRAGIAGMMTMFRFPALYRLASSLAQPVLGWLSKRPALMRRLPILRGWASGRTLPAPEGRTFLGEWQRSHRAQKKQENKL
jgi:L-lactate dehydrogenase complex protein LldF